MASLAHTSALNAGKCFAVPFDLQKPLAWVGADKADRLLISDRTKYGLQRRVVARKNEIMDVETWLQTAEREASPYTVELFLVEIGEYWFLWMLWKEQA